MTNTTGIRMTTSFTPELLAGGDLCEHITHDDLSKAVGFTYERDSFGYVGAYICCKPCMDKIKEEIDNEPTFCHDCNLTFPKKETRRWTPYDFYEAQGDVATIVCDTCVDGKRHQDRVALDDHYYRLEFGFTENDCDEDDE